MIQHLPVHPPLRIQVVDGRISSFIATSQLTQTPANGDAAWYVTTRLQSLHMNLQMDLEMFLQQERIGAISTRTKFDMRDCDLIGLLFNYVKEHRNILTFFCISTITLVSIRWCLI